MELNIVGLEAEGAAPALAAPLATVRVHFENLPPESRLKLDDALRSWAAWHADKYIEGFVPPQVVSGSLGYDPARMRLQGGGALAWEERPEAPAKGGVDTLWFNIAYEKAGDVPRYDRSASLRLHHSKRKLSAAAEGLLAADEAEGVGRPVKRQRGANRCFNCGSFGHSMRECWKEQDRAAVEEARREHNDSSAWAGRSSSARYYEAAVGSGGNGSGGSGIAAEREKGEFGGLAPGRLSAELRAAMGIGELAPPPWLHRMRELGLPPGYMCEVPAVEEGAGAAAAGTTHAAAAAAAAPPAAPPAAADGEPEDFISLPASPSAATAAAAAGAGGAEATRLECSVQFPGVNAPAPEGADPAAWGPPHALHPPALPPGFGTPPPAAASRQVAAVGSAGHGSSGPGKLPPLRGLHPPRQAAPEHHPPAASAPPQQHHHQQQHHHHRHHHHQQQHHQQQPQQAPQYTPPLPGLQHGATAPDLAAAAAQHARHLQHMQQGVCTVSSSDPGHLLAVAAAGSHAGHSMQQGGGQPAAPIPRLHGWAQPATTPLALQQQQQQQQPVYFALQQPGVQLYAAQHQHFQQQQYQQQQPPQAPQYTPGQHVHMPGGGGYSPHQAAPPGGFGQQASGPYGQQAGGYGSSSGGGGWHEAPPPQHPSAEQLRQQEEHQRRLWHGTGR